ncbi:MAG: restriction endonuclease, partial [Balneola sp.]|nr:restriction endonuclease [Balneola sp.]
ERSEAIKEKFGHIPYLNSSLFDVSDLEHDTTRISGLTDATMPVYSRSVLNDLKGKELSILDYLFRFLEAYDFSAEGKEEIRSERKSLINASVLGLIFEKINGYKDGSFYTPGFITEYMARETLRKAVTDKFIEAAGIKDGEELTISDLYNHIGPNRSVSIEEANELVNSITICDPAVGSGHFLVSSLNELLAIKSDLGILCDVEGKAFRDLNVTVENDELIVSFGDDELFEYDVSHTWKGQTLASRNIASERQRIQQALFHEKRYLIENCLFGVDINANSVKICRLRLWIELLKRAFYTPESEYLELEVLPNIDINIKQGNSLVSRFELDSDLTSVFKDSDHSLEDYKEAVRNYKHTGDRSEKQRLQKLITEIKEEYTTTLTNIRPINKKLSKERGRLELMQNADLFGDQKFTKKDIKKQKQKVEKLEEQKAEEESGAFYNQAFEWRFEFPEVLDEEGSFVGFDVVIANPPYIGGRDWSLDKSLYNYYLTKFEVAEYQFDAYVIFWEQVLNLSVGYICLITPNTWLNNQKNKKLRNHLLNHSIVKIVDYSKIKVFDDATVLPIITLMSKKHVDEKTKVYNPTENDHKELFLKNELEQDLWKNDELSVINIDLREEDIRVINRIEYKTNLLEELCTIRFGIKIYETGKGNPPQKPSDSDNHIFESNKKIDSSYRKYLTGKNIDRFVIKWDGVWLKYGENLAAPRDPELFEGKRILVRRVMGDRLICAFTNEDYVTSQMLQIIKPHDQELASLFLAILNSKLISYYFRVKYNRQDVTFPEIRLYEIKDFPVPIRLSEFDGNKEIQSLSNQILAAKKENPEADTSELEAEIDRLVYELYGLSEEEIGIVEGSIN